MNRTQYIVGGTLGWLTAGTIGAGVADASKKHPLLKGAVAAGDTGALFTTVMSTIVAPEVFDNQQSGVSGQLAGPPKRLSRHITSSRFP